MEKVLKIFFSNLSSVKTICEPNFKLFFNGIYSLFFIKWLIYQLFLIINDL